MWDYLNNTTHSSAISAIASIVQALASVLSLAAVLILSNESNKITKSQRELTERQYNESQADYDIMTKKIAARLGNRFEAIASCLDGVASRSNPYFLALNGINKGLEDELIIRYIDVEITNDIFSLFEKLRIYFTSFMKFYEQNHPDSEFGPKFGEKAKEYRDELSILKNKLYEVAGIPVAPYEIINREFSRTE